MREKDHSHQEKPEGDWVRKIQCEFQVSVKAPLKLWVIFTVM
jgi:hypothetical protein